MIWETNTITNPQTVKHLQQELNIPELITKLLVLRGITNFDEAKSFFRPNLNELHNPFLMLGMDKAIKRIEQALNANEKILIYGDYDVDGTTAVALVYSYFKTFYKNIDCYIPDRYKEGYGISFLGIDYAEANNYSLIIALDCGIKAVDKVEYAQTKGIDFIICDHHLPGEKIPAAVAVLDPKQPYCEYPYKELCGCGIGFKLIQAFHQTKKQKFEDLIPYLDLVVVATAADIVPITGENRILAFHGLQVINSNPREGFKALLDGIHSNKNLTISDVVFQIAPRINAAGRIKHGNFAVQLLAEKQFHEAHDIAQRINDWNTERKSLDKQITEEALEQIKTNNEQNHATTVVYQESWHKGVIGIVASRLIETYYRPTLVFTKSGDFLAASARSVQGFDVYQALESCQEHLIQFGGHKYAAGLSLLPEKYKDFKNAFEKVVKNTLPEHLKTPTLHIDSYVNFTDFTPKVLRILKQFEPHGPGNSKPTFASLQVFDTGFCKTIGKDCNHLSLFLNQHNSQGFPAIQFGGANSINHFKDLKLNDIVYTLTENVFNNTTNWQLMIKDSKPSM